METPLGHELGTGLVRKAPGAAEVVRVGVGDDDCVDVADLQPGVLQAGAQCQPRGAPRHTRVDEGGAAVVEEGVAVHVAETREQNRYLQAEDTGPDFGDLVRSRLLFLLEGPVRRWFLRLAHSPAPPGSAAVVTGASARNWLL